MNEIKKKNFACYIFNYTNKVGLALSCHGYVPLKRLAVHLEFYGPLAY